MRPFLPLVIGAVLLGGCSASTTIRSLNPFGSDAAPDASPAAPVDPLDRIATVETVEVGQAYRGVIVHATGFAALQGFHLPRLRLLGGGPGPDGMIELEFVAAPPEAARLEAADPASRRLIAALFLPADMVARARGVRVIAADGAVERLF